MKQIYLSLFILLLAPSSWAEDANPADQLISYDRNYYLQIFDYVMDNTPAGQSYLWQANSAKGEIAVGNEYLSKSKYVCRDFSETFNIELTKGTSKGTGCKRQGKDGWCRITEGNPKTCALEKRNTSEKQVIDKATDAAEKIGDWLR